MANNIFATVQVGPVQPDDFSAVYTQPSDPSAVVTDYRVRNRYEEDRRTYMLGVSSPSGFNGSSVAFVQLATPTLLWIADWTAARWKQIPQIPDPSLYLQNWVLLDKHYDLADIKVAADGVTPLYRITGTYIYGLKNPGNQTLNDLRFGLSPEFENIFTRTVPATNLTKGILDGGNANVINSKGF